MRERINVRGRVRHEDLSRWHRAVNLYAFTRGIQPLENAFPIATDGKIFSLLDDKTSFTDQSTRADMEDLDAYFQGIVIKANNIGISGVAQDDGIALHRAC